MKSIGGRLDRLEARVGVSRGKEYMIVTYGHRRPEDCLKQGRPLFRCSRGKLRYVVFLCEMRGSSIVNSLEVASEKGRVVLQGMGYEEIKCADDLPVDIDKAASAELIQLLMRWQLNTGIRVQNV